MSLKCITMGLSSRVWFKSLCRCCIQCKETGMKTIVLIRQRIHFNGLTWHVEYKERKQSSDVHVKSKSIILQSTRKIDARSKIYLLATDNSVNALIKITTCTMADFFII